jgi:hypothetical protein
MIIGGSKIANKLAALLGLAVLLGLALWFSANQLKQKTTQDVPPAGQVRIEGMLVCLPHRDTSGPQTLECAFGLKDDQGRYFALRDSDPGYGNISGAGTDARVAVEGIFAPGEDDKYQSVGVIEVTSLREVVIENSPVRNLPSDVLPEQIRAKYSVNGSLYAFAMQNNLNYNYPELSGKAIAWHGVLRSADEGQSWEKFLTITDPADPGTPNRKIKYNPVGGFMENGNLYLDIANDQGAGSGEGQMIRFSTGDDGKTWQQAGCFYFIPERYYPEFNQGKTDMLSPHDLDKSAGCVY